MRRAVSILTAVLAAQVVLAGVLHLGERTKLP